MQLQMIDPAIIVGHPNNPRREVGNITELTASVKAKGVLEPLVLAGGSDVSGFVLIAGHRRHAAAVKAKLGLVPCIVRDDLTTPQAQLEAMLVENLQRVDLSPVEEAEAYQALLDFGDYTPEMVAKSTGRSVKTVRARLALTHLPDAVKDKAHAGQLSLADAAKLAPFTDDEPDVIEHLANQIGSSNFDYAVRAAKERAKYLAEAAAAGATVTTTNDARIEALEANPALERVNGYKPTVHAGYVVYWPAGNATSPTVWWSPPRLSVVPAADSAQPAEESPAPTRAKGGSMVQKAAEKKEREARQAREAAAAADAQRRDQLRIAAESRNAYLADLVASREQPTLKPEHATARALRFALAETLNEWGVPGEMATLIGFDLARREPAADQAERLVAHLDRLDVPALAFALAAVNAESQQSMLTSPGAWHPGRIDAVRPWLDLLTDALGYQLSDVEQELLDQANTAPADES